MLEITPAAFDRAEEIIRVHSLSEDDVILLARENGEDIGFAAIRDNKIKNGEDIGFAAIQDDKTRSGEGAFCLTAIDYRDELAGELLLRACASYAERRFAKTIFTRLPMSALLLRVGFVEEEGGLVLDISKVIHYK